MFLSSTLFYVFLCKFILGMLFVTSTDVLFLMHSDGCCVSIASHCKPCQGWAYFLPSYFMLFHILLLCSFCLLPCI